MDNSCESNLDLLEDLDIIGTPGNKVILENLGNKPGCNNNTKKGVKRIFNLSSAIQLNFKIRKQRTDTDPKKGGVLPYDNVTSSIIRIRKTSKEKTFWVESQYSTYYLHLSE